ncbi:MAG: DUF3307 domain-containing protein [Patescibacteria group bacterium]
MFAQIVFGHLFGDYMFQSKAMALKKSEKGWRGNWWCVWHCLIYTAWICLFLWTADPLVVCLIFLSHWFIDRYSLGSKWLKMIRGRDFIKAFESKDKYRDIDLSFSCLVYAVVDNTMHLVLIWLIVIILL